MSDRARPDLRSMLPAGEWLNLQILHKPTGMMADHNWAIHAKATWARHGGTQAYIKLILPAPHDAGEATEIVTGAERLRMLEKRLKRIQSLASGVPVVSLLEVQLSDAGLLIAMEHVRPLQDMIERGEAYGLSVRTLRDLDPDRDERTRWLHYDICPRNIGVTVDGSCVLIDLDSLYLAEDEVFNVSVPAWKPFRSPLALRDEINECQAAGPAVALDLARKKMRFEVALVAAECVLGPMPTEGEFLTSSRVEKWLREADPQDPCVDFWARELRSAVDRVAMPPLREIVERLQLVLDGSLSSDPPPLPMVAPVLAAPIVVEDAVDPVVDAGGDSGWALEWAMLKPAAHALRAGRLDGPAIRVYRSAVEGLAARHPTRREAWEELLLVLISYQRDARASLEAVEKAAQHVPGDRNFQRLRQIVQTWASERQR